MSSNRLLNVDQLKELLAKSEAKESHLKTGKRDEADLIAAHFKRLNEEPGTYEPPILEDLHKVWNLIPEDMHEEFRNLLSLRYLACGLLEDGNQSRFEDYIRMKNEFLARLPAPTSSSSSDKSVKTILDTADDELRQHLKQLKGAALCKLLTFEDEFQAPDQRQKSIFHAIATKFKKIFELHTAKKNKKTDEVALSDVKIAAEMTKADLEARQARSAESPQAIEDAAFAAKLAQEGIVPHAQSEPVKEDSEYKEDPEPFTMEAPLEESSSEILETAKGEPELGNIIKKAEKPPAKTPEEESKERFDKENLIIRSTQKSLPENKTFVSKKHIQNEIPELENKTTSPSKRKVEGQLIIDDYHNKEILAARHEVAPEKVQNKAPDLASARARTSAVPKQKESSINKDTQEHNNIIFKRKF